MIKSRFIYSNLMHLLVMDPTNQQAVLSRVYKWCKVKENKCYRLPAKKSEEQLEGQIQSTFKSTLPEQ